jgi:RNA polymerase sigma-70 factor (ECF subfamily)
MHHLEVVEDAAQSALLAAVETWPKGTVPENPSAWLSRVAWNHAVGELRGRARRDRLLERFGATEEETADAADPSLADDVRDDLLQMLFACCEDSIPAESQLVIALKTLSGFSVGEIAERLFLTEANVYKRLGRARTRLRELRFEPQDLTAEQLSVRTPTVEAILYTMFTEGYLSSHANHAIRRELCDEATRLATVLAEHPTTARPATFALVALMQLHAARMSARQDDVGGLTLLEEQDRSLWDRREIQSGLWWLARSAQGEEFSRYHGEAAIAAEHCLAPTFAETRWDRIVELYVLIERTAPSPLHTLNRALAVAEWKGPEAGLAVVEGLEPPSWLAGSYLWWAVLADLHRRCGRDEIAARHRELALESAPSAAVKEALRRRLDARALNVRR